MGVENSMVRFSVFSAVCSKKVCTWVGPSVSLVLNLMRP